MSGSATIDRTADFVEITDTSGAASYRATPNFILGITGAPLGTIDSQAVTNKTIGATNTITQTDSVFILQNLADSTKKAKFDTASITTATTRTYTLPDATTTLVGIGTTQTLTNKILTAPTINNGSITGTTITTDAIVGQSASTSGTVYGMSIASAVLGSNTVPTAAIQASAVTFAKTSGVWWEELGRNTLGIAGDTISVSITARKYLQVYVAVQGTGGTISLGIRFNSDSGNNYSARQSDNGAADATTTSTNSCLVSGPATYANLLFGGNIVNISAQEKLMFGERSDPGTAGAANAANKSEQLHKWANTAAQISTISTVNSGTGDYAIGSEMVILGHD